MVVLTQGWRIVNRHTALSAGVQPSRLQPLGIVSAAGATTQAVQEHTDVWAEQSLGDGWVAAYRIAAQDGRPVVAEVRVFPDAWGHSHGARPPGVWAGEYLGPDVRGVPAGGLSATVLRRLTLARPVRDALAGLDRLRKGFPHLFATEMAALGHQETRSRIDDASLARIAAAYVKSGHSAWAVASQLGTSETTIRGRVMLARKRGLLTASGKSGVRAGELTPRARRLLRKGKQR